MPSANYLPIIYELLPGFIAAWIFYGLTAHAKPDTFERIIQALIFTGVCRLFTWMFSEAMLFSGTLVIKYSFLKLDHLLILTKERNYALSIFVGIVTGLSFSYLCNSGLTHSLLPRWLTTKTSYPSQWYSAFKETQSYIYLRLEAKDGTRSIHGWPEQWPDSPSEGHFILVNATWIGPDGQHIPLDTIHRILIPVREVKYVEFDKVMDKLPSQSTVNLASPYNPL